MNYSAEPSVSGLSGTGRDGTSPLGIPAPKAKLSGVHCVNVMPADGPESISNGALLESLQSPYRSMKGREAQSLMGRAKKLMSRRAAAGRPELLAKKGHTGRVQNPAKVSENRPACGTAQHTLAVCFVFEKLEKSRKFLVKIWRKFSKILAKFWQFLRKFRKNQQKFQQFLTKILRLKNGAKECIV